jgi:hypothetical protein
VRWDQDWSSVRPRDVTGVLEQAAVKLFPLGLTADRRVLYGVRDLGPVLVAGLPTSGVWRLVSALVVDRLRRQPPRELAVITIAAQDRPDPLLADAPQQRLGFVDPSDAAAVTQVVDNLDAELHRRLEQGPHDQPDMVLVVDEWADLPDCGPTFDLLARHGASVRMYLIASTTRPEDARLTGSVTLFQTRLVLQTPDESASIRVLGQPGAEELDRVGQAVPWLGGEVLSRVRGFSVPPAHIQHLVTSMCARVLSDTSPSLFEEEQPAHHDHDDDDELELDRAQADVADADAAITAEPYRQAPLIATVALAPQSQFMDQTAPPDAPPPPIAVQAFGRDRIAASGGELAASGAAWELFRIVCCLPPGKASFAHVAALKYPGEPDRKVAIQRLRQNKSNLQKAWAGVLPEDDAKRLLTARRGVLWLAEDLVTVDVHVFLCKLYDANRARIDQRLEDAISFYQQVRALYAGPLLSGRDEDYEWLAQPVEGRLTLRESYRHHERVATERLAELLVATERPADAGPLYADLMRDPGPPDAEADELEQFIFRQYAFREECARAVFECCRLTRDLPGLQRAYRELQDILRALAADADVAPGLEGTEPGAQTQARFQAIYAELSRGGSAAASD